MRSETISFRRFVLVVVTTVVALSALFVAANRAVNLYAVFGNVRGRSYRPIYNEREFKYLFSYNYIPSNFDGLLVGTSITDNWDTSLISGARVYNASISGGNISEEALIADNVLRRSRPKLVLFCIHPYLTESYGPKTAYMTPQMYWGALGSVQLLYAYANALRIAEGQLRQPFDANGLDDYDPPKRPPESVAQLLATRDFDVDERALRQFGELVMAARRTGVRIAAIIPPVEAGLWQRKRSAYEHYHERLKRLFAAGEPVIDLNELDDPRLRDLREHADNFPDGAHLSREAARRAVAIVDEQLRR